jgi:creatinine amidohydrolase
MSGEVRLERLSQPEAEKRLTSSRTAVLAPGSVEQHGPHLPLGTDAFAADALAHAVANQLAAVLVPLPLIGVSPYHRGWTGSLSLQPQTLIAVIRDVCECLAQDGVDKVLLVNWHEGNTPTLRLAAEEVQRRLHMMVVIAEGHIIAHELLGERAPLTHAGTMEAAAVMMHDASLVHPELAVNPTPDAEADAGHAIFRRRDVFPVLSDFHEVARTGWYGDPSSATPELAEEMLEKVSTYIADQARILFARGRTEAG